MNVELASVIATVGLIATCLSIVLAVVTLSRNKRTEDAEVRTRLTRIETDIMYVREKLDKREQWETHIEDRIRELEKATANG